MLYSVDREVFCELLCRLATESSNYNLCCSAHKWNGDQIPSSTSLAWLPATPSHCLTLKAVFSVKMDLNCGLIFASIPEQRDTLTPPEVSQDKKSWLKTEECHLSWRGDGPLSNTV